MEIYFYLFCQYSILSFFSFGVGETSTVYEVPGNGAESPRDSRSSILARP